MVSNRFASARNVVSPAEVAVAAVSPSPFVVLAPAALMEMQCLAGMGCPVGAGMWGGVAAIYEEAYRRARRIVLARQASERFGRDVHFATARNAR